MMRQAGWLTMAMVAVLGAVGVPAAADPPPGAASRPPPQPPVGAGSPSHWDPRQPLVFVYGAQMPGEINRVAQLGANALLLDLAREPGLRPEAVLRRVDQAQAAGLRVIIGLPTIPTGLNMASPGGQRYRESMAQRLEAIVTRLREHPGIVAWATGDFLEDHLEYNAADLRAYLLQRYGTLEALNLVWGSAYQSVLGVSEQAVRDLDLNKPFGLGRASVDVADFRSWAYHEVMAHWARIIKAADPGRPLMTGRIGLYRALTSVPAEYDVVCPYLPPDTLDPDLETHNVHAVDMVQGWGKQAVVQCLQVPAAPLEPGWGALRRWISAARLRGVAGFGLVDWGRIAGSAAPEQVEGQLAQDLEAAHATAPAGPRPQASIAVLHEPYAGGYALNERPVYGYLGGLPTGEPNNPLWAFRAGCRYGLVRYVPVDRLGGADLEHCGVLLAPLALRLPELAQGQVLRYVQGGGALLADLGLGMYETANWLQPPPSLLGMLGIGRLAGMSDVTRNLSVSWVPDWLPGLEHGVTTQGSWHARGAERGETPTSAPATSRRTYHVSGPAAYAELTPGAALLAVLDTRFIDRQRVLAGVIANESGAGVSCFATHALWANWVTGDPTYVALHDGLCRRRAAVELLGEGFWPDRLCATATEEGLAVWNGRPEATGADVLANEAEHWLYDHAVCAYSAEARREDGQRSGAARVSVWVEPESVVWCRRYPVLVQPYEGNCLARLVEASAEGLALRLGGNGAAAVTGADGTPEVGEGAEVLVRVTVEGGVFPIVAGRGYQVSVENAEGQVTAQEVVAGAEGTLRFDVVAGRTTVKVRHSRSQAAGTVSE